MKILEKKDKRVESYEQELLDNGFSKHKITKNNN